MKKMAAVALAVGIALAMSVGMTFAQDAPASDNAVKVVVTGANYCVQCALKAQGAQVACDVNGHQHALKVADIRDAAGNYVRGFVNKTVYYVNNAKGKELCGDANLLGKPVTIEGTLFKDERIIDIASYKEAPAGAAAGVTMSGQVGAPPAAGAAPTAPAAPATGATPAAPAAPAAPAQK